jgi:hypothetical protein
VQVSCELPGKLKEILLAIKALAMQQKGYKYYLAWSLLVGLTPLVAGGSHLNESGTFWDLLSQSKRFGAWHALTKFALFAASLMPSNWNQKFFEYFVWT